jgi:NADH:ubiquinone reductase (H+-translocating)
MYRSRDSWIRAMVPRVVIVGAGFGGLAAVRALKNSPVEITVIDRHNYHLFQPLLYQVATASLSPAEIAQPIRSILKTQKNVRVILADVAGVDTSTKSVRTKYGQVIPYDYLVIATGARHAYFGHDEWEKDAPGIKSVDDATRVRSKILLAFERAEAETTKLSVGRF